MLRDIVHYSMSVTTAARNFMKKKKNYYIMYNVRHARISLQLSLAYCAVVYVMIHFHKFIAVTF